MTRGSAVKRTLLVLLLLSFGAAFARSNISFAVNDQGYTYFKSKGGYLQLRLEGDKLVFHLTPKPTPMKLVYSKINTPNYMAINGEAKSWKEVDYRKDPMKRINLQRLADCDVSFAKAVIRHENGRLTEVYKVYQSALSDLGFQPTTHVEGGRARDYVYERGNQRLQMSFYRGSNGRRGLVQVTIKAI